MITSALDIMVLVFVIMAIVPMMMLMITAVIVVVMVIMLVVVTIRVMMMVMFAHMPIVAVMMLVVGHMFIGLVVCGLRRDGERQATRRQGPGHRDYQYVTGKRVCVHDVSLVLNY
ncbi:hypothetical protein [Luminiphilus syltensis]|uniref:hypothetical protein n=1 Tax=Luminiphilus syltensis TaxID=1341119 RepID=UPI0002F6D58D|nr:hypothetical protein [Luminiphilus syltensis]